MSGPGGMTPERWEHISDVLGEALELAPSPRETFLAQACAGDSNLLSEVESLLAATGWANPDGQAFMESPLMRLHDMALQQPPVAIEGDIVGRFRITSKIGAGGMGEVYLAEDPRLRRRVAIKLLRSDVAHDSARRRRFLREARAAAALSHPNICAVHEIGEASGAVPFLAMEYVEGESLRNRTQRARLANAPLSVETAIDIVLQVARGLAAAHAAGVLHRDVKPENILIRPDGIVKVVDFSVAAHRARMADMDDSGAGLIVGTRRYIAPELQRGEAADQRADVWSLGAVLLELVPDAPPELQRVTAAALAVDPDSRLPDMRTLIDELERAMRVVSLQKPGGSTVGLVEAAGLFLVAAALAAGFLLVAAGVAGAVSRSDASPPLDRHRVFIAPFVDHTGDSALDALGHLAAD